MRPYGDRSDAVRSHPQAGGRGVAGAPLGLGASGFDRTRRSCGAGVAYGIRRRPETLGPACFPSRRAQPMPTRESALPGRPERIFRVPRCTRCSIRRWRGPGPDGDRGSPAVAMGAALGAERISWRLPGWSRPRPATWADSRPTRRMRRRASRTGRTETILVAYDPAATRPSHPQGVLGEHDPTTADRQAMTSERSTARRSGPPPGRAAARATRAAFQTELARRLRDISATGLHLRGGAVLVCRGLPPAVPPQEPGRLAATTVPTGSAVPSASRPAQQDILPPSP